MVAAATTRLRSMIAESYAPGDQLPNEKQLADDLEVSRGTMREVLGALATDGTVVRRWGVGTFVSEPRGGVALPMSRIESYRDRLQAAGHDVTLAGSSCEKIKLPAAACRALGLALGSRGWRVTRVYAVDGVPTASMVEFLPTELLGVIVDPHPMLELRTNLYELLDRTVRGCVARAVTDLSAIGADADRAADLGLATGAPVLQAEQVTYSPRGEPLAYGITVQRTDVVRMRITR
ncbi:GntR family transcriptional regulator [Microlunatus sp. GCM10028923]|uniref:GntR family transcriptional regulator n=1 Tax=Microlunatus sp. GCM10028923 TaxID=3273400 RepID=UPI003607B687